jgi:hypothetical protein
MRPMKIPMKKTRIVGLAGAALWVLSGCAATPSPSFAPLIASDPAAGAAGHAAHHQTGLGHLMAERYGLAVFELRKALREKPQAVETLNALGVAHDHLGQFDVARGYYERALALDPDAAQTLNNLGRSALRQGHIESALAWLERAERLAPDSPEIAANLAEASLQTEAPLAAAPPAAPAASAPPSNGWIERTDRLRQTLVTTAPTPVVKTLAALDLPPQVVHVASAPDLSAPPRRDDNGDGNGDGAPPRQALREEAPEEDIPAKALANAAPAPVRLEIANGAGRRGMAARMRAHLAKAGAPRARLTNADRFAYATSAIFYRPEFADSAAAFSRSLPVQVALIADESQRSDVKLRLGGDLLAFDLWLLKNS